MRFVQIAGAIALLSFAACSSQILVAKNKPHPSPPHAARGPVASLGIPPGHYPPPGHCRVWLPGQPPGHQPRPVKCNSVGDIPLGCFVWRWSQLPIQRPSLPNLEAWHARLQARPAFREHVMQPLT